MGIKDRRTKIIFALIILSNNEYRTIKFTDEVLDIFELTLNKSTLKTFKDLQEEQIIEGDIIDDVPVYKLTEIGFVEVTLIFPAFRFQREKWDGLFRVLSYEIPENKRELRDKLRREVARWGLGPWHRSFWLTPHPIISSLRRLVSDREEEKYVQAFESKHVFGDQEILIEKVWNTKSIERSYRALFKKWHTTLSRDQGKTSKLRQVVADYVEVLKADPGLPKQLVGDGWIGFEAVSLFREIRDILLSPSQS